MATDLSNLDKFLKGDTSSPEPKQKEAVVLCNIQEILNEAQKKQIQTEPLDIRKVASEIFGIEILEQDLGREVSGFLERIGTKWKIYLNKYENESRKRFTIAHELGHFIFHRPQYANRDISLYDQIFFRDENTLLPREKEANIFASNLLMPEDLFKRYVASGNNTISKLADKFQLSTSAVKYRAYKLGMISEYK